MKAKNDGRFYRALAFRSLIETAVCVAAWPMCTSASWWRYAVVVGGINWLRIFFGRELSREYP